MRRTLFILSLIFAGQIFAQDIVFEKTWIKAVPSSMKMSAMFGVLKNNTDKDMKLMSVSGDLAKNIEIHNHIKTNGVMKMRKIPFLLVPAKGQVELKPMHEHIMFIGLKKKLEMGKTHSFVLNFDNGETLKVSAEVKKMGDAHKGHHH